MPTRRAHRCGEPRLTPSSSPAAPRQNMIHIWLTPDGTDYVIDSVVPLEVGGEVCTTRPGNQNELVCQAPLVAGFEVNAGAGDDSQRRRARSKVPATMQRRPRQRHAHGGSGADKLVGGAGNDMLVGQRRQRRALRRPGHGTCSSAARATTRSGAARGRTSSPAARGHNGVCTRAPGAALGGQARSPRAGAAISRPPTKKQGDQEADQREAGVEPEGRLDAVDEGCPGRRRRSSSGPARSSRRRSGTCRRCRRRGWSGIRRPR